MFNLLLDLIFPPRCVGCNQLGKYLCQKCRKTMEYLQPRCPECDRAAIDGITHPRCLRPYGLNGLVSVCRYDGVMKKAIKLLKYRFVYDLVEEWVATIPTQTYYFLSKQTPLYPLPLHRDRLRWRGFNQAEKLANSISMRLKFPVTNGLLIRIKKRTPQADISKRETRLLNARGIFNIQTNTLPSKVILIDDVWTTGATMKEACTVLKRNGVDKVWGLTLAR